MVILFREGKPVILSRSSILSLSLFLLPMVALATLLMPTWSWDMSVLVGSEFLRRGGSTEHA